MDKYEYLGETKADHLVALTKGALGVIPYVGGIAAEIVGVLIPGQRLDRLADFLRILGEMVAGLQQDVLEQRMKTEEFMDLFEDALWQASRARTEERRKNIAAILKYSLYEGEINHLRAKELLSLLGELNDAQIIILKSKGFDYAGPEAETFYEQHRAVLQAPLLFDGADEEDYDNHALHQAFVNDLQRLGLVKATFKKPKKNELPEFDIKTGMVKVQSTRITHLGRLLLRYIEAEEHEQE